MNWKITLLIVAALGTVYLARLQPAVETRSAPVEIIHAPEKRAPIDVSFADEAQPLRATRANPDGSVVIDAPEIANPVPAAAPASELQEKAAEVAAPGTAAAEAAEMSAEAAVQNLIAGHVITKTSFHADVARVRVPAAFRSIGSRAQNQALAPVWVYYYDGKPGSSKLFIADDKSFKQIGYYSEIDGVVLDGDPGELAQADAAAPASASALSVRRPRATGSTKAIDTSLIDVQGLRPIFTDATSFVGPRGGVYHYSASGKKVYSKRH